jgi:signal transduction histidine kinase
VRPTRPNYVDFALAVGVYTAVVVDQAGEGGLSAGAVLLAIPPCLVLLARRRVPLAVLIVTLATAILYAATGHDEFPMAVTVLIALFSVGERYDWPLAMAAATVTALAAFLTGQQLDDAPSFNDRNVVQLGWCFAAVAVGGMVRTQRAYLAEALDRAARAERTREEEARRRVAEERLRIARELHDAAGHAIATVNVQAGVAAHVLEDDPAEARLALARVREASGTALTEMRSTLRLLRAGQPLDGPPEPIWGIDDLGRLIEGARSDGLPVTFDVERDSEQALPAVVGLTVYRVVQEALTNVVKHAKNPTTVMVRLRGDGSTISVEVLDDGEPRGADERDRGGQGLQGMRERIAALGGSLHAGPRERGGFEIHAEIPTGA